MALKKGIRTMFHRLLLLLAISSALFAHNNLFRKGDAYFHFYLTDDLVSQLKAGERPSIQYGIHRSVPFMRCGYVGAQYLNTSNMPDEIIANLVQAYERLRMIFLSCER